MSHNQQARPSWDGARGAYLPPASWQALSCRPATWTGDTYARNHQRSGQRRRWPGAVLRTSDPSAAASSWRRQQQCVMSSRQATWWKWRAGRRLPPSPRGNPGTEQPVPGALDPPAAASGWRRQQQYSMASGQDHLGGSGAQGAACPHARHTRHGATSALTGPACSCRQLEEATAVQQDQQAGATVGVM